MTDLEPLDQQLSQYVRMSTCLLAISNIDCLVIFIPFRFADNVLYSSNGYACAGAYTT